MQEKKSFIDDLNREIEINFPPQKILSTVPSISETLGDLELEEEVVGVTRFCVHPSHWKKDKTIIGGTKRLNYERIIALEPDLIIGNKEENLKPQVEELAKKIPFWISEVNSYRDNLKFIKDLGVICDREELASKLISNTESTFKELRNKLSFKPKVLYFIWRGPYMLAASNTFITSILEELGFENAAIALEGRYPKVNVEEIRNLDFDFILLSSEPFPFNQLHCEELKQHFPSKKILFVDGEIFSYYGSRLSKEKEYLEAFINEFQK